MNLSLLSWWSVRLGVLGLLALHAVTAVRAAYPDTVLADRPTGYWKLTEPAGVATVTNVGSSGTVAAGRVMGAARLGATGFAGTAAAFDGTPGQIEIPYQDAHNRGFFTVETWAQLSSLPAVDRCLLSSLDLSATAGYQLLVTATGRWQFLIGGGGSSPGWEVLEVPAATGWTHLVAQYDGTNMLLYVNGLLAGASRTSFRPNALRPLRLGADSLGSPLGSRPWLGGLGHVAVYDKVLTAGAIGRHYTAGSGLTPSTTVAPQILVPPTLTGTPDPGATVTLSVVAGGSATLSYQWRRDGVSITGAVTPTLTLANLQTTQSGQYTVTVKNSAGSVTSMAFPLAVTAGLSYEKVVLADLPAAYWRFGESAGATAAADQVGANRALASGSVGWEVPGIQTDAGTTGARFSWLRGASLTVPGGGGLMGSPRYSIEVWARVTGGTGTYRSPLTARLINPLRGFMLYAEPGDTWQFWYAANQSTDWVVIPGPRVRLGAWDHLAVTCDGVYTRFYVNGLEVGQSSQRFSPATKSPIRFGAGASEDVVSQYFFEGDIDEAAYYSSALTAARVAAHAASGRPAADTTPPRLTPGTRYFDATSPAGGPVTLDVTALDANDGPVTVSYDHPAAGIYPLGDTVVRATATDAAGNRGSLDFTVTVIDRTPPVISWTEPLNIEATSPNGATLEDVRKHFQAIDAVEGPVPMIMGTFNHELLTYGTHRFQVIASDSVLNEAWTNLDVHVVDTTPPTLVVPGNLRVPERGPQGTRVIYDIAVTDAGSVEPLLAVYPPSGSIFPVGTSEVRVEANDDFDNYATTTFLVTVEPSLPVLTPTSAVIDVNEGEFAVAGGQFSDAGGNDTVQFRATHGNVVSDPFGGTWSWSLRMGASAALPKQEVITADDGSHTVTSTVSVQVHNLPPTAQSDSVLTTVSGVPIIYNCLATDPGGDPLTFRLTRLPLDTKGTAQMFAPPALQFVPSPTFRGVATVEFTATDDDGATSAPARIAFVNLLYESAPVALSTNVSTTLDTPLAVRLPATDSEGDQLYFRVAAPPAHGVLDGTPPNLTYTPEPGFSGADNFVFTVSDGYLNAVQPGVVTISVGGTAIIGTRSFTNAAPVVINAQGAATPYASPIRVSGLAGKVSRVTLQLRGFTHPLPDDVDVLLVSPTGRKAIVFSDVGGTTPVTDLDLTLADAATVALPDATVLTTGTFKPLNYGTGDTFPSPAPVGPYLAALNQFNNTIPNGDWTLYVVDDTAGNAGVIQRGWTLTITTVAGVGVAGLNGEAPELRRLDTDAAGGFSLRVGGVVPGEAYVVERSADLVDWRPYWQGEAAETELAVEVENLPGTDAGFFRCRQVGGGTSSVVETR